MNLNLSIEKICSETKAKYFGSDVNSIQEIIQNVVIDSRSPLISAQTLFITFEGNKTSGRTFVSAFAEKGGRFVLTDRLIEDVNINQLLVEDTLDALQKLARFNREKYTCPVIGITGSNGKTTVKEWLYHVLKNDARIVRSPKSYNSQIGVALSVLEMSQWHDLAVFEAGISAPGEMEKLVKMIQPTIGVFTGIGDAHNSGFNSENPEEEKRREKYKLFEEVDTLIERKGADIFIRKGGITKEVKISGKVGTTFELHTYVNGMLEEKRVYQIPFSDEASISNAAIVAIVAQEYGATSPAQIQEGLLSLPTISMRLEKMAGVENNTLINDVYNLDEKSLEIGLQYLDVNNEGKAKVVFIAEDPEIVKDDTTLLRVLERFLKKTNIETVVYFGPAEIAKNYKFVNQQYEQTSEYTGDQLALKNKAILFTGARSCRLESVVNTFRAKKHITRLQINLHHIRKNLNIYRHKLGAEVQILAMVKAQSYGGGIVEMARFLEAEDVAYFGVAYADEGVVLRQNGIQKPILVMNPEPAAFDDMIQYNLEPSIYSIELLNSFIHQLILQQKRSFPIHIKLDTGMNRLGFRESDFQSLFEMLSAQPEVYVKSVFSHLSVADVNEEVDYTILQIDKFKRLTAEIESRLGYSFLRHLANSAGAYHYPNAHFDMVRLGIGLFGLLENHVQSEFENVLQLSSQISQIRTIDAGESVGYGRAFQAKSTTTIGVVPVGYSDGLRRALGNGVWSVVIQGKKYPIIGNVCMDMCMVDLGNDPITTGTEVQLFGSDNSIFEMAEKLETIPYEIISAISSRVHRVYTEE